MILYYWCEYKALSCQLRRQLLVRATTYDALTEYDRTAYHVVCWTVPAPSLHRADSPLSGAVQVKYAVPSNLHGCSPKSSQNGRCQIRSGARAPFAPAEQVGALKCTCTGLSPRDCMRRYDSKLISLRKQPHTSISNWISPAEKQHVLSSGKTHTRTHARTHDTHAHTHIIPSHVTNAAPPSPPILLINHACREGEGRGRRRLIVAFATSLRSFHPASHGPSTEHNLPTLSLVDINFPGLVFGWSGQG